MDYMKIYKEWIAERNNNDDNAIYSFIDVEKDHVHALIECAIPGIVRYGLYQIKEDGCVEIIKTWSDLRAARTAFELFCYDEPKIFEQLDSANMQIALYDEENRKLKAIIKGMLEERYLK